VVGNVLNVSSKLRSCIEDQNSRHAEDVKEAKSKVAEAKDKVTASDVTFFVSGHFLLLYRVCNFVCILFIGEGSEEKVAE